MELITQSVVIAFFAPPEWIKCSPRKRLRCDLYGSPAGGSNGDVRLRYAIDTEYASGNVSSSPFSTIPSGVRANPHIEWLLLLHWETTRHGWFINVSAIIYFAIELRTRRTPLHYLCLSITFNASQFETVCILIALLIVRFVQSRLYKINGSSCNHTYSVKITVVR